MKSGFPGISVAMAEFDSRYELEQLANQPGTYFNPHTEVVVIVDDSTSIDQDVFDLELGGSEWVRISDEVPVDESALEDAMDAFQSTYHPVGESVTSAVLDPDEELPDPDDETLEPDPDETD